MTQLCRIFWFAVFAALLLCPSHAAAQVAPAWSPLNHIDDFLSAVSCPSPSFCVAVERTYGKAFIFDGFSWTSQSIDTTGLYSVSCVSPTFCVAGDRNGDVLIFNGSSWSSPQPIDSNFPIPPITAISCASTTFCAAGDDDGNVMIYNGSSWSVPYTLDPVPVASGVSGEGTVTGMSCPNPGFCVAVDQDGKAYTYAGGGWTAPSVVDSNAYFFGVSCASPNFCIAADFNFGAAYTYTGSWSGPSYIDKVSFPSLLAVSCASSTFCVALDGNYGTALTYNGSTWSATPIDTNLENFESVSCPSPTFCVAVDNVGNAVIYRSGLTLGELVDKSMISPGPQSLTYNLAVVSTDQSGTTGVTVTDTLPTGASLVSATSTQGSCSGTQTVVCSIGSLPSGTKAQIAITVTANWAPGKITNTATIAANGYPTTSSNTVTTIVRSASDLSIVKTATPATLSTLGDALVYTLTVQNNGPYDVLNAEVIDNLPPHVLLESVSPAQECSGRQSITCNLAIIASGSSAPIALTVIPLVGSVPLLSESLGNTASVTAPFNDDPIASNDSSSVTVNCPYCAPQAITTLTLTSSPNPSAEGQTVVFTARITTNAPSLPSGSVDFSVDGISVATQPLDISGVARYSTSSLTVAAHTITASYAGDNFYRSSSRTLTQMVNASTGGTGGGTGGSCACQVSGTVNYKDPASAIDVAAGTQTPVAGSFTSANGKYTLTIAPDYANQQTTITVARSGGGNPLFTLPAPYVSFAGFSPDGDRLAMHYVTQPPDNPAQALDSYFVLDLSSATSSQPLTLGQAIVSGQGPSGAQGRLQFSPSGRYFVYTVLGSQQSEVSIYRVQGVTQIHEPPIYDSGAYPFQVAPGTTFGEPGNSETEDPNTGGVGWGFSPDNPETSFVYAYGTGPGMFQWVLVNLAAGKTAKSVAYGGARAPVVAAYWQFSQCADVAAVVSQPNTSQEQVDWYDASTGGVLSGSDAAFPLISITLETTSSGQQAVDSSGTVQAKSPSSCGKPNTPAPPPGAPPVEVTPEDLGSSTSPVTLIFSGGVSQAGQSTLNISSTPPSPPTPNAFQLGNPPMYYNLSSTAIFTPPITICINYTGVSFNNNAAIQLFHYDTSLNPPAWINITVPNNQITPAPQPNSVCGQSNSMSPFALFEPAGLNPANIAASGGTPQTGTIGSTFATPLQATVTGSNANLLSGIQVVFAAPAVGATGSFGGATLAFATTNASGVASAPAFTANGTVGSYSVTATANGLSMPATFALTNTQLSQTTTSISAPTVTYGTTASVIVSVNSAGNSVSGNVTLSVDGAVGIPAALANGSAAFPLGILNAGSHTVSANFASQGNFLNSSANATLVVRPSPLTLTADNKSKGYGAAMPNLTFTASGFLNGETASTLATPPTLSISANAASAVGNYLISISGAVDPNYAITYVPGQLTITPAPLTITANNAVRQYGQVNPQFTASYSAFVNGESESVLNGTLSCTSAAIQSSAVAGGPYAINCSGLTSTNYAITYIAGALTITSANATITADNRMKILDALNPAFTWSASGFLNGETASVVTAPPTCNSNAVTTSPVGSYPITCSGALAANYTFSYVPGTLKILYATNTGHVIQPPINTNGLSVFNAGRTIPAKFSVYDANGVSIGTTGVVSSFYLTSIISGTVTTAVQDVVDTNNPDTAFRWDPVAQQWIFNITTGNLSAGSTYVYTITLNDGTSITFQYGLR